MAEDRYQYRHVVVYLNETEEIRQVLDKWAIEGWELHTVTTGGPDTRHLVMVWQREVSLSSRGPE